MTNPARRLDGRVALVTGAARGIGLAIARRFHAEGARMAICDLNADAAASAAAPLDGLGVACDVSDSAAVDAMLARVVEHFGTVDILVNNAGISGMEGRNDQDERNRAAVERAEKAAAGEAVEPEDAFLDVTDDQWRRMLAVHMDGTFFCSRATYRVFAAQGKAGCIINMGSIMGTFGRPGATPYSAAKAGILGFTRALAHEAAERGVRVNAIAPGWIETDMTDPLGEMKPLLTAGIPLGRFGDVDDIAAAAAYLASDDAKYVTGQVLSPNGGWYMSQ